VTDKKMTLDECDGCPGMCCNGLEEQVIRPRTKKDIADYRWQLHFENTHYFIRNRRWYQLTLGACQYLDDNHFCTIYEDRPEVCRDHLPPACERHGEIFDVIFRTPEDFDAWLAKEERRKKRKANAKKKAKA
jgi:hypothetical protein